MPTARTLDDRPDERIVERTEDVPAELEPGDYVVVDSMDARARPRPPRVDDGPGRTAPAP